MRLVVLIALLVTVAVGSYVVLNAEKTPSPFPAEEMTGGVSENSGERVSPSVETRSAPAEAGGVICPLCNGEMRILRIQKGGGFHREHPLSCPLCFGKGKGSEPKVTGPVCPNCYGMGHKVRIKKPYVTSSVVSRQGGVEGYFEAHLRVSAISVPPSGSKYKGGAGEYVRYGCGRCNLSGHIRKAL